MKRFPHDSHIFCPWVVVEILLLEIRYGEATPFEIVGYVVCFKVESLICIKYECIRLILCEAVNVDHYFGYQCRSTSSVE